MAHEGVTGYGTFEREWAKFQKRAASTAESVDRALAVAAGKATAPTMPSAGWPDWAKTIKDTFFKYAPLGLAPPGSGNIGEAAVVRPTVDALSKGLPDFGGYFKWAVVGLIALGVIIVVPRIIR